MAGNFSGVVTVWGAGAQSMFGLSADEVLGRPLREIADFGLTALDFAEFVFVASAGAWTRELDVTTRSGEQIRVRLTATLAAGPDGVDEIISVFQQLPQSADSEAVSDQHFRLIAERGSDLVVLCNRDRTITYAGPSLLELYGYHGRDVIGTNGGRYVHPQEAPRLKRAWQAALTDPDEHPELEVRVRAADGGWRWVQLRISNLLADVAISAMVVNLRDITDQRGLAERLAHSERTLNELMDAALEGIWVMDRDGRTVLANTRMADLLKVDYTRLCGGSIFDFIDPVAAEFIEQRLSHQAAGVRERYDFSFLRGDGSRRWFHVSAVPRYDDSGAFIGSIAMCTDITERKLMERELGRRATTEADAGDRERPFPDGENLSSLRPVRSETPPPPESAPIPGFERLSRRELEVVKMLLRGDRVPVISRQLFVSQSTVRNHLSSVFRKLRVRSQQELIVLLRERKLPT